MSNQRYTNALDRLIELFKSDFLQFSREQYNNADGKLIHPGEFGGSREKLCQKLFENTLPKINSIELRGFIINANNDITKEQDIVFYRADNTPLLTLDSTKFFPVETVVGVVQVKSVIRTKDELRQALDNLAEVKKVRDNMGHETLTWRTKSHAHLQKGYTTDNPYDQVSTFLVCEKIDFTITAEEVDEMYEDLPHHLKHNLILDITNGLFAYNLKAGDPVIGIPFTRTGKSIPVYTNDIRNNHIKHFLTNLQIFIPSGTIYHPDMGHYLRFT